MIKLIHRETKRTERASWISFEIDEKNTGQCCDKLGWLIHHYPNRDFNAIGTDKEKITLNIGSLSSENKQGILSWEINFCPYCGEKIETEIEIPKKGIELFC